MAGFGTSSHCIGGHPTSISEGKKILPDLLTRNNSFGIGQVKNLSGSVGQLKYRPANEQTVIPSHTQLLHKNSKCPQSNYSDMLKSKRGKKK